MKLFGKKIEDDVFTDEKESVVNDAGNCLDEEGVVNNADDILNKAKLPGLEKVFEKVKLLLEMVTAYVKKQYREIPKNTIVAAVFALAYVFCPIDVLPDTIPGVGLIDDATVVAACVKALSDDLELFKKWRDSVKAEK